MRKKDAWNDRDQATHTPGGRFCCSLQSVSHYTTNACYSLATHEMVVAAVLLGQQWAHHTSYFISYLQSPQQHTHAQYFVFKVFIWLRLE